MFRNKILLRAEPLRPAAPFLLRRLSLPPSSPSPSLPLDAEILCCRLSRRRRLACIPLLPSLILLLYQRIQSESAAQAVDELVGSLPISDVGEEEEADSASLVASAVECALRSAMLERGWRCIGDCTFVHSTFACQEERSHLYAVNVSVQLDKDDGFVFVVSPDVLRFSRHKISDLLGSKILQEFDAGQEVNLEEYEFSTSCTVLPSLYEGHVIGLRKLLPDGEDFKRLEELWSLKHGLVLTGDYFMCIQLAFRGHPNKQWFPSPLVLQGSGLAPAPQTIRASKAVQALEHFIKIVGAWNFFDQGLLKIKEVSSLAIGTTLPVWKKAGGKKAGDMIEDCINSANGCFDIHARMSENNIISKELLSAIDFRTPKPALHIVNRTLEGTKTKEVTVSATTVLLEHTPICINDGASTSSTTGVGPLPLEYAPLKGKAHIGKRNGKITSLLGTNNDLRSMVLGNVILTPKEPENIVHQYQLCSSTCTNLIETSKDRHLPSCTQSEFISNGSGIVDKHASVGDQMSDLTSRKVMSEQTSGGSLLCSLKASREKENTETCLEDDGLAISGKHNSYLLQAEASQDRIPDTKENKNELEGFRKKRAKQNSDESDTAPKKRAKRDCNDSETAPKKRAKQGSDGTDGLLRKRGGKQEIGESDMITKVMGYHARDDLCSLTVADLKCFLATRKAKVGGKKEDLIQRITALLS